MPIFVSRFSPNRVSGANLQRVRTAANQATGRAETGTARRERQTERTRRNEDTRQNDRAEQALEALLSRTQLGQQLAERFQSVRNRRTETQTERDSETEPSRAEQAETRATARAERRDTRVSERIDRTLGRLTGRADRAETGGTTGAGSADDAGPVLAAPPGVGAVRSRADDDVERPGRLDRAAANPARELQLERFAQLRALRTGEPGRSAALVSQENRQTNVPGLNREADGRIRLIAANARTRREATPVQVALAPAVQPVDEPMARTQEPSATVDTAQATTLSAEEISRANTTPEIQSNLRQDTREVAQGLSRDAIRQTQQTTQRMAQNAVRADETRREDVQKESREQVRALEVDARQLERELQQTERELRQERTRAQRAGSAASGAPAATAAAIGTNVNILAG